MADQSTRRLSGDAIDQAQHIFEEALAAYRRQVSEPLSIVSTDRVRDLVKEALARPGGGQIRVVCTSSAEEEQLELADLLRGSARDRSSRVLVLHCHPPTLEQTKYPPPPHAWAEGLQARFTSARLPHLIMIDEHTAIMRTSRQPGETHDVLIRNRDVVFMLNRIHEEWWKNAAGAFRSPRAGGITLDSTQMFVLAYLCDGVKDETAARAMNISLRTYRRLVAGILKSVDANSRFQAGLKAALLGLTFQPTRWRDEMR